MFPPRGCVEAVLGQVGLAVLLQRAWGEGFFRREMLGVSEHQVSAICLLDWVLEGFERTLAASGPKGLEVQRPLIVRMSIVKL